MTPSGHLRITAPPEFGALLAPALVELGERYPAITVEALITQRCAVGRAAFGPRTPKAGQPAPQHRR